MPPSRNALRRAFTALAGPLCATGLWALAAGCGPREPPEVRAERAVLERERANLEAGLRRLQRGEGLLAPGDVLISIEEGLVQSLLASALPVSAEVDDRIRLTAHRAAVEFRSGLALVRLAARASPVSAPGVYADLELLGVLEVEGLDEEGTGLLSRVEVLGFRTQEVGAGRISRPVARLLDEMGRLGPGSFASFLREIRVPIGLERELVLPEVREPEISIPGARLPLAVGVLDATVVQGALLVSMGVRLLPDADG